MRMLIISLIFLLLMIGIWTWYNITSIEPVTEFYVENGQWERADEEILLYISKWDEIKNIWVYFIDQKDLDAIETSIKKANVYISHREKSHAQAELEHMSILFNGIKENERLMIHNIF